MKTKREISAISPAGLVATGFSNCTFSVCDLDGNFFFGRTLDPITCFSFASDGRIAIGTEGGELQVWNREGKMLAHRFWLARITSLALYGNLIAIGTHNSIYLEKIYGKHVCGVNGQEWVRGLAFSPDGQMLASGNWDHTVRLWRITDDALMPLFVLKGHTNRVIDVTFSPDGQTVASGADDGTVRLWSNGQLLSVWSNHRITGNWVADLSFSPGGQLLVGRTQKGTVCLWSRCLWSDKLHLAQSWHFEEFPQAVAFVGDRIVVATEKGTVFSLNQHQEFQEVNHDQDV